jgi:hypothetical protein
LWRLFFFIPGCKNNNIISNLSFDKGISYLSCI